MMSGPAAETPRFRRPSGISRWVGCLVVLIISLGSFHARAAPGLKELNICNLGNTFIGIHLKDSRLAFQVVMNTVYGRKYPNYRILMDFPADQAAATRAIADGRCHALTLTGLDYIAMRSQTRLEPLTVLSKVERPVEPYLLLTAVGMDLERLSQSLRAP